ncbi:NADH-quinone oxidoreductase subunit C [Arenimonas caeni]|uniref:NADH-quinone oxidoreductase subunit C n=1 Tax=Arenimonas caeni TaxID=2058085 RepID=A0A2P6M9Z8_9GAMM|nr:NADH-quinone oxidoreductase subunit C [Arenimonas caeni]PRH82816.1 NADH-quinone oxidoreductase subunit C [Arenimonas caeni]
MVDTPTSFHERLKARLQDKLLSLHEALGETTVEIAPGEWDEAARILRDDPDLGFEQLIDLCGVDYLGYGEDEWETTDVTSEGFSRGVEGAGPGRFDWESRPRGNGPERRFAVVVHLQSVRHNRRLRIRCFAADNSLPVVPSLVDVYPVANWFERECFDLFGIVFEGHPDLRRILTDYGFVGHPFRKDFPLVGNVEVRYDAERKRVVYEPVSIEPRVGVPRVVREDSRWQQAASEQPSKD